MTWWEIAELTLSSLSQPAEERHVDIIVRRPTYSPGLTFVYSQTLAQLVAQHQAVEQEKEWWCRGNWEEAGRWHDSFMRANEITLCRAAG